MGNTESHQLATVLLSACEDSGDCISAAWLTNPEVRSFPCFSMQSADFRQFCGAVVSFLQSIRRKEIWDELPARLRETIGHSFWPDFSVEKWAYTEIFRKQSHEPATRLYRELCQLSKPITKCAQAKRNVYLVAFSQIRRECAPKSFATYLSDCIENDKSTIQRNCNSWGPAGERLEKIAHALGGYGALLCGIDLSHST